MHSWSRRRDKKRVSDEREREKDKTQSNMEIDTTMRTQEP